MKSLIIKPLITEKATITQEKYNRYSFLVGLKANKSALKNEIEKLYNVKVINIKTSILPGKVKRVGKSVKKTSKSKKAFVTLEAGQEIKYFTGV
jgi:large subunit ribosomal protein L23